MRQPERRPSTLRGKLLGMGRIAMRATKAAMDPGAATRIAREKASADRSSSRRAAIAADGRLAATAGIEAGLTRARLVARVERERDPEILGPFVSHRWWQVRWAAIESLGKTESPASERYLLQVLATSDNKYDLGNANAALGQVGSNAAIPALTGFIHHPIEDVKALGHPRPCPPW